MSFIELDPVHSKLAFSAEIVKPKVSIDGGPEMMLAGWRPSRIAVAPRQRVRDMLGTWPTRGLTTAWGPRSWSCVVT